MSLDKYIELFSNLRFNRSGGRASPHKACLLLAVIDLIDEGVLKNNRIPFDASLKGAFSKRFEVARQGEDQDKPETPFFYLTSEGFWHLRAIAGQEAELDSKLVNKKALSDKAMTELVAYAMLDDDLYQLLQADGNRSVLAEILKNSLFNTEDKKPSKSKRPIVFGEIEGIEEGHWFSGRREMMPTSFHRSWGAGIDGNAKEGTAAIVLSGGYEDDEDLGDEIIYTGAGGNDPKTKRQEEDQTWENNGNAGLLKSYDDGLPVRVIRGYMHKSEWSPTSGYTYAGLYSVAHAWQEIGRSGHSICRFRLVYAGAYPERKGIEELELDHSVREKRRRAGTVLRVVRDGKIALQIKTLYGYACQVCGLAIATKRALYAEGAHIRPLGKPHEGDDSVANLLCLCPNHHVMFDKGAFSVCEDLTLTGSESGKLNVHPKHQIDLSNFAYHRGIHGYR